uniref:DUF4550 domain-containing protein n=1 Tax=Parastrongyloides trichosuri TaxID=131310 RepID=A0A0N4ZCS2_PARTI
MVGWLKRKPIKSITPFKVYDFSEGDPKTMFINIIVREMESKIGNILDKKEQNYEIINDIRENKECVSVQPNYLWLMDYKYKERKTLSIQEYGNIESLVEKTNMCEWSIILDLWSSELDKASTRSDVLFSFEEVVKQVLSKRIRKKSVCSISSISMSMSQLMNNDQNDKDFESDVSSTTTAVTILSIDTLITSDSESIQLNPLEKSRYNNVLNIV